MNKEPTLIDVIKHNFSDISHHVIMKLKTENPDYLNSWEEILSLQERYPKIVELLNGQDAITLTQEEHQALKAYLKAQRECQMDEEEGFYLRGHADCFHYLKAIGAFKGEKEGEP